MSEPEPLDAVRLLESNITDGFSEEYLDVYAGRAGAGGAPHTYTVIRKGHPADGPFPLLTIKLQHGNPKEVGVNGIGTETLLLIVNDFLTRCQSGPFASPETAEVLACVIKTQEAVKKREEERKTRGVYQTHAK